MEAKEVRICCCPFLYRRPISHNFRRNYKNLRYETLVKFNNIGPGRVQFQKVGRWFRNNVYNKRTRERAYLTLSSLFVTIE